MHFAKKNKKAFNPLEAVAQYRPKWDEEEEVLGRSTQQIWTSTHDMA